MNKKLILAIALIIPLLTAFLFKDRLLRFGFTPTKTTIQTGLNQTQDDNDYNNDITIVAKDLSIPWEVAFLPNGELLLTQRPGTLLKISQSKQVIPIAGVEHIGEGGLLGLALHPDFKNNHLIYLYLTTKADGGLTNRVDRYRLEDSQLFDKSTIIKDIPGAKFHDGGRIAFGPDQLLYITTGDAGNENLAQDINTLNGKILRLKDDGSIPPDNPFENQVFTYGHRNPQGLAWDDQNRLWATEHGRSGIKSGFDELNLIVKGKNYGWPIIQGPESKDNMTSPLIQSGPTDTWAPAGIAFVNNSLFFAGLRGEALYEAQIDKDPILLKIHFKEEFGRLRAVTLGPDGFLYLTTSNTDGRGDPQANDDQLIKINPDIFE